MSNMERLTTIRLRERHDEEVWSTDDARIEENGDLRLDAYDVGELPKRMMGDDDYEYWVVVPAEWKDTILLKLIKERFKDVYAFHKWARENAIAHSSGSWA
jgi:hypothetical protein